MSDVGTILKISIALGEISHEEVLHETLGILVEVSWESHLPF
jgi:hypothetical protein